MDVFKTLQSCDTIGRIQIILIAVNTIELSIYIYIPSDPTDNRSWCLKKPDYSAFCAYNAASLLVVYCSGTTC